MKMILENEVVEKIMLLENVKNKKTKKHAPKMIFFNENIF